MNFVKILLLDYNTSRSRIQKPWFERILLAINALQVISLVAIQQLGVKDKFSGAVSTIISLFNLPYLCFALSITPYIFLFGFLFLFSCYPIMIMIYLIRKNYNLKSYHWLLNPIPKINLQILFQELLLPASLAISMQAIFPDNFSSTKISHTSSITLGIILTVLTLALNFFLLFVTLPFIYEVESMNHQFSGKVKDIIRNISILILTVLSYNNEKSIGALICLGAHLCFDTLVSLVYGRFSNVSTEEFFLKIRAGQIGFYFILIAPKIIPNQGNLMSSLLFLLMIPAILKVFSNLRQWRNKLISRYAVDQIFRGNPSSMIQSSMIDVVVRQLFYQFSHLTKHKSEIFDLIEPLIQSRAWSHLQKVFFRKKRKRYLPRLKVWSRQNIYLSLRCKRAFVNL